MSDAWDSFDRAVYALEESKSENEQLRARLERVETALRDAIGYLAEVGPHHLDSGMDDSGCDRVMTSMVAALGAALESADG
jgi:hypothetical protein